MTRATAAGPNDPPPRPFLRHYPPPVISFVRFLRKFRTPPLAFYAPRSTLELPPHEPARASVRSIDFHAHLGRWLSPTGEWTEPDVGRLLEQMESLNVSSIVNLDGRWGSELEENLDRYDRAHPDRFYTFCHLDWRLLQRHDGPDRLVATLHRSLAAGARGLKVWKDLGLGVEVGGRRILPDDPMLYDVWEAVADAGVPVLIHVADPVAFFLPADRSNERLEEMLRHPRGAQHDGGRALFLRLIDALESLVATHPRTTFVSAHGCYPENLGRVDELLGRYPNLHIDISAASASLGRQPRASRKLIVDHADQVLFGTDIFPIRPSSHRIFFRLLETDDEAFDYSDDPIPRCGRWKIYGLDLPPAVLEKVYRANAERLLRLPGAGHLPPDPLLELPLLLNGRHADGRTGAVPLA
jgi:predicted TIM-barrel fold metal-dependent hydrolase